MINRIYSLVLFISNNELRGNVAVDEFNQALYNAIIDTYEEYFFELNRVVNRENRGLINNDFSSLSDYYRERIKHYLTFGEVTLTANEGTLPSDLRYLDAIHSGDVEVEPVSNSRIFRLAKKNPELTQGNEFPIYLQKGNKVEVLPATITGTLDVAYLRNPKVPKWTYTMLDGVELFNPSANDFQDVDMHVSEEGNLIRKVLLKMGMNLKEQDLTNYMLAQENQQFNQENAS